MDTGMYDIGLAMGRHWAQRDATREERQRVRALGDGKDWVANNADPAKAFFQLVDADEEAFLGTGEEPSDSFIAGFIDGARAID